MKFFFSIDDTTDSRPRRKQPEKVIPEEDEAQGEEPANHVVPVHNPEHGKVTQTDSFDSDEDLGDQMFNERILDIQNTDPDILGSMEALDPELLIRRDNNPGKRPQ